jgi:hypothetical protein
MSEQVPGWLPFAAFVGALAISGCIGIMIVDWLMERSYARKADE